MQRFDHTVTKLRKGRSSGKIPFEKKCELCSAGYTSEKTSQSAHPTGLVMFASHVNTIDANPASKASRFHNIAGRRRERQRSSHPSITLALTRRSRTTGVLSTKSSRNGKPIYSKIHQRQAAQCRAAQCRAAQCRAAQCRAASSE